MTREGKGKEAPSPVVVHLDEMDIRVAIEETRVRMRNRPEYNEGRDAWKKGLPSRWDARDVKVLEVRLPVYRGICGEIGLTHFVNQGVGRTLISPDFRAHEMGDGGIDFELFGVTVGVKTRTAIDQPNLIRVVTEWGVVMPIRTHWCVFARFTENSIYLHGWIQTRRIRSYPVVDAWRGYHKNIEVPDADLLPMNRLISEILCRIDLRGTA